jgi:hypothetical protein
MHYARKLKTQPPRSLVNKKVTILVMYHYNETEMHNNVGVIIAIGSVSHHCYGMTRQMLVLL